MRVLLSVLVIPVLFEIVNAEPFFHVALVIVLPVLVRHPADVDRLGGRT